MGKILWIVSLLCIHLWCGGAQLAPIPCNDKNVEKLSRLAITYINEDRTAGYKFALNRISNVHLHAQGPVGNVFYLDLDVLETKCHVKSPIPWKHCPVRPFMETQISGNCNTTVLHTAEGLSYLYSYDCTLVPDPPEKLLQKCPDCPLLLSVDSPQAQAAARLTLRRHNAQSTLPSPLALLSVTRAAAQGAPVQASFVEYTVFACPEGHMHFSTDTCVPTTTQEATGFCTGAVFGELEGQADVQVSCQTFNPQVVDVGGPAQPQAHDVPLIPLPPQQPHPGASVPVDTPVDTPADPTPAPPAVPSLPQPAPPAVPSVPQPAPPAVPSLPQPAPSAPLPFNPAVLANPNPANARRGAPASSSESSESVETDSSSEELGGAVVRPPANFRYVRPPVRRRRQAPVTSDPPHAPVFMTQFPDGTSPFRSCPGAARYTTV